MRHLRSSLLGATLLLAAPVAAHANLITNGQFGSTCGSGNFCSYGAGDAVDIPGWLVTNGGNPTDLNGSVDLITGYWQAPPGGGNSVDLDGNAFGGVSQSFATVLGQEYTVSFFLSGNPDGAPATKDLGVDVGGGPITFSYPLTGSRSDMDWLIESFTFVAASTLTTLSFTSLESPSSSPGFFGPAIGNVTVEATPEPMTIGLIGFGVLALLGFGARARRV